MPEPRWFSLGRIFTREHLTNRVVMTIRIYLDESEGDTAYVASGWACRAQRWDGISEAWQMVLDTSPKISYFKMNEAMGFKGPFLGWDDTARDEKVIALARTIPHEDGFFGHGCYVARSDFEAIKDQLRERYQRPYFFCVAAAIILAVAGEYQIVGADAEKIDFVLDRSKDSSRMRNLFYSDIKPRFPRLGECTDLDDKETLPLQAADLNAAVVRQLYEDAPRTLPGASVLSGIFESCWELKPTALQDIIRTSLFKKKRKSQP